MPTAQQPSTQSQPDPPARPIENATRITVAFPFSTIRMGGSSSDERVQEIAELVAGLAAELDAAHGDGTFRDLAARARTVARAD